MDRFEFVRKAHGFSRERTECARLYVAGLSDDELEVARAPFVNRKNKRLTGREDAAALKKTPRTELLLLRYRIWDRAGQPGRSKELIEWEA